MSAVVGQLSIDFIRQDDQIMGLHNFCNGLPVLVSHDRPCGIIRKVHHQQLGARGNSLFQCLGSKLETLFCSRLHLYQCSSVQIGDGRISNIAGRRNNNLISRSGEGTQRQIQGFTAADRYYHLVL
ncbi:hypothetical protein D3C73_1266490 [compost metagenome]